MRIRSGSTTTYLYFIGIDGTDGVTRKTGLSGFTVVRSRNGAADVTYTTPTVSEIDATTMPGLYALLLDEDTTVASGADAEEMAVHITVSGMVPVTRVFELFRREVTAGEVLTVSSGTGNAAVQSIANNAITAASVASNALTSAKFAAGAFDAVWTVAARLLTAGTNIVLAKGTGVTGFNDLSAAQVNAEADTAISDAALATASALATVDTVVDAIKAKTDNLPSDPADASDIADRFTTLDAAVDALPTNAELATALGTADDAVLAQIALVKAQTDSLTFTVAGQLDVNLQYVNDVEVTGNGQAGTEWGP